MVLLLPDLPPYTITADLQRDFPLNNVNNIYEFYPSDGICTPVLTYLPTRFQSNRGEVWIFPFFSKKVRDALNDFIDTRIILIFKLQSRNQRPKWPKIKSVKHAFKGRFLRDNSPPLKFVYILYLINKLFVHSYVS